MVSKGLVTYLQCCSQSEQMNESVSPYCAINQVESHQGKTVSGQFTFRQSHLGRWLCLADFQRYRVRCGGLMYMGV